MYIFENGRISWTGSIFVIEVGHIRTRDGGNQQAQPSLLVVSLGLIFTSITNEMVSMQGGEGSHSGRTRALSLLGFAFHAW